MQIAKASKKAIIWFFVVLEAKIPIALKPAVKKIEPQHKPNIMQQERFPSQSQEQHTSY